MNLNALGDFLMGNRKPDELIESITIETRLFPPITINQPLKSSAQPSEPSTNTPNAILNFIKPKITVRTPIADPISSAPYGEPKENLFPLIVLGLASIIVGIYLIKK